MGNLSGPNTAPSKAIICTLAVALMLAGTRWGAYIGYSPLFLTDMLIAVSVMDRVLGRSKYGAPKIERAVAQVPLLFKALYAYIIVRGVISVHFLSLDWIRDLMPFLYGFLVFLAAADFARAGEAERRKTMKYLWWALLVHLGWVSAVVLGGIPSGGFPRMPNSDVAFLSVRSDVDMAFLGLVAALILRRIIRNECNRVWGIIGLLLAVATAASLHSRAGLISLAVALVISYWLAYSTANKGRHVAMTMAVPVILAVSIAGLAQTTPGERLLASISSTSTGSLNEQSARGTERARELTWSGVTEWTLEDGSRTVFGSGFGNDFLEESGVKQYLEGSEYVDVRSPHNWFVGIFARMGVVGLGLTVAVLAAAAAIVVRNRRQINEDELLTTATLGAAVLIPVGTLGVVLESPFGAIPFWWFLGILFSVRALNREKLDPCKAANRSQQRLHQGVSTVTGRRENPPRSLPATK